MFRGVVLYRAGSFSRPFFFCFSTAKALDSLLSGIQHSSVCLYDFCICCCRRSSCAASNIYPVSRFTPYLPSCSSCELELRCFVGGLDCCSRGQVGPNWMCMLATYGLIIVPTLALLIFV